ncbi:MAG TPA: GNAT family N-acetyltransferase [Anaerolineales bacterium]|nr:GNAT family N-acetyltransferase [Anaerolineales bacterium]
MLIIQKIDKDNKKQVNQFIQIPFDMYKNCEQWVPPILIDAYAQLNPKKHPFYEHSEADFFIALMDNKPVGRIGVFENRHFNEYHQTKEADFYFFDSIDNQEVADALFNTAEDWAINRGLTSMVGPKGMGPLDGYGILIFGHEHRQTMNMLNYNYPYYQKLVENHGYHKEVDFVSCFLPADQFKIPDRVAHIAERALERGELEIKPFKNKREMLEWAPRIGEAYNRSFVHNWEYFPFTPREIDFVVESIMTVADHRLIKIITHAEEVVGFLFAFPDISAAMKRANGKIFPFGLIDMILEMRRTKTVAVNGIGILPKFQGHGGNAILYTEMGKTLESFNQFNHVEMSQVAETTEQMRADLKNLNGVEYKNHRVYRRNLNEN